MKYVYVRVHVYVFRSTITKIYKHENGNNIICNNNNVS